MFDWTFCRSPTASQIAWNRQNCPNHLSITSVHRSHISSGLEAKPSVLAEVLNYQSDQLFDIKGKSQKIAEVVDWTAEFLENQKQSDLPNNKLDFVKTSIDLLATEFAGFKEARTEFIEQIIRRVLDADKKNLTQLTGVIEEQVSQLKGVIEELRFDPDKPKPAEIRTQTLAEEIAASAVAIQKVLSKLEELVAKVDSTVSEVFRVTKRIEATST